jgi:hypothetical protein
MVHTRIWGDNLDHDDPSNSKDADNTTNTKSVVLQTSDQATFATVTCVLGGPCATSGQCKVVRHSCTDLNFLRLPTALLKFLTDHFGLNVRLTTEYVRHLYTFQSHSANQSGSATYNWINVKFNDKSICSCQLAAVVVLDDNPNNPERFAFVGQAAVKHSHIYSVIFAEWSWSSMYRSILPNTTDSPCFVISIKDDGSEILVAKPFDEWPAQFTTLHHYRSQELIQI